MEPIGLSIPDTGKALGGSDKPLSRNTIYRMIGRGELEAFKMGSRTLVSVPSIKRAAENARRLTVAA
ncbi:DNA-binding protein [Sphingomonas sp.]|uniref:DNA-binding protein n=1 Tax=Sphingomonas sp. TaxID=28214 RepID=UPI0025F0936B|nr:DNA-binding protein [Sphingomonas sp.]